MNEDELVKTLAFHRKEYLRLSALADAKGIEYPKTEEDRIRTLALELDEANKKLLELVVTDSLTGIGNRRMLMNRLESLILEAERGRPASMVMLDVDNFKKFNDAYGHQAGDRTLRMVAETIIGTVRKIDCVARYGGEEFAIATATALPGAMVMGEKVRAAVAAATGMYGKVTVSVGIAQYQAGDTAATLIQKADRALYRAKNSGRDCVVLFDLDI